MGCPCDTSCISFGFRICHLSLHPASALDVDWRGVSKQHPIDRFGCCRLFFVRLRVSHQQTVLPHERLVRSSRPPLLLCLRQHPGHGSSLRLHAGDRVENFVRHCTTFCRQNENV
uniref:Uncharacterized protein n=1 Tax=Cacopsylla melanoneura TaxID=428564 RepID=A0A8D8ZRC6_9HEMI